MVTVNEDFQVNISL